MWIATNRGFLSIVSADPTRLPAADKKRLKGAVPLCVRARSADHLRAIFPGFTVYEWKGRDYPARIFIGQDELADIVAGLVRSVRYPNFKNSVADGRLHDAYMAVWSVMHRYQNGGFKQRAYNPAQATFYDRFTGPPGEPRDMDDAGQPIEWDDEPCTAPGCTDMNPCLDCLMDAMADDPRSEEELLQDAEDAHRAKIDSVDGGEDLYGDFDTGDDRDDDDGAQGHLQAPPL
jgi:hypothetical protein